MERLDCPFGPEYNKYWQRRYDLFSRFDEGIRIDVEGLFSAKPEQISLELGKTLKGNVILDAFGGVGASVIGFARSGRKVICVEINVERCEMIRNNLTVYGVSDLVTVINDDVMRIKDELGYDAVYLDPPWGGPDYIHQEHFYLHNFRPDGNRLLEAFGSAGELVLSVPVNFDLNELMKYARDYSLRWESLNGQRLFGNVVFAGG
jgi:trimethylguanosine synthase